MNFARTLILLSTVLTSCGGPGVVFEPGEATKKLPATTKAVEEMQPVVKQMQPVVDRVHQEQSKGDLAHQIIENAGRVEGAQKEKHLRILSPRGNFLTASQFQSAEGIDLCTSESLLITEDLIDDQKIISLAERLSRCKSQALATIKPLEKNRQQIIFKIPSIWIAKRFEITTAIEISSDGHALTIVAEVLSIDTTISTQPILENRSGGNLNLAAIKLQSGPHTKFILTGGDLRGETKSFSALSKERQTEIIQESHLKAHPPVTTALSISPNIQFESLPPEFSQSPSTLALEALNSILSGENLNSSCLPINRALRGLLRVNARIDQVELKLKEAASSQQYAFYGFSNPNHFELIDSEKLFFEFFVERWGQRPQQNQILISPTLTANKGSVGTPGRLSIFAGSRLLHPIEIFEANGEELFSHEFSAFEPFQASVTTQIKMGVQIKKFIQTNDSEFSHCFATKEPLTTTLIEKWPVTLIYKEPAATPGPSNLKSASDVIRENDVTTDPRLLFKQIEEWNLPREALDLAPLQTFKALASSQ